MPGENGSVSFAFERRDSPATNIGQIRDAIKVVVLDGDVKHALREGECRCKRRSARVLADDQLRPRWFRAGSITEVNHGRCSIVLIANTDHPGPSQGIQRCSQLRSVARLCSQCNVDGARSLLDRFQLMPGDVVLEVRPSSKRVLFVGTDYHMQKTVRVDGGLQFGKQGPSVPGAGFQVR